MAMATQRAALIWPFESESSLFANENYRFVNKRWVWAWVWACDADLDLDLEALAPDAVDHHHPELRLLCLMKRMRIISTPWTPWQSLTSTPTKWT
jgi:hypothetical protein